MCEFFSFCTKGSNKLYFNWQQRQELIKNNPEEYNPDSHTSICHFHKVDEDKVNKYEFNPLTKKFEVDQINIKNDRAMAKKWVEKINFKTIVEPLIVKEIVHPFKLKSPEVTDKHIELLKQWDSVGDSVGDSVWTSVWTSVGDSVRDSVRDSISSFIHLEKWRYIDHDPYKNPFQSCVDLWDAGFIPSFDGKTSWRLHAGEKAQVVFKISKDSLNQ